MERSSEVREERFTEGRGGIRLPELPTRYINSFGFMAHLNKIWEMNGHDVNTHDRFGQPQPFRKQMVFPEGNGQPAVAIRISYKDARGTGWHRHDEFGITELKNEGYQTHKILLPPSEVFGDPEEFIKVEYRHTTGHGHTNAMPFPVVTYQDEEIIPYKFNWNDEAYSHALKDVLQVFHDLVS